MPDAAKNVTDAEAELAAAEQDLANAEAAAQPAQPVVDERTDAEILAAAPPLVLPEGQKLVKTCSACGLNMEDPPANMPCPNCGTPVP